MQNRSRITPEAIKTNTILGNNLRYIRNRRKLTLQKLPKYTSEKGKAFSYFSIVAKNYLIQNNNKMSNSYYLISKILGF